MSDNNDITAIITTGEPVIDAIVTTEEPAVAATLDELRYLVLQGKAGKAPRVSATTGNWEVYDNDIEDWADTGISASTDITPEQLAEAIEHYFDEHPIDIPTDAVLYTPQTLTPAQQEQARTNIGAGTYTKPSGGIPDSDIASAATWNAKYTKPASGIQASDLASAVQTSLGKADTALQSHQSLAAYRTATAQDTIDAAQDQAIAAKYTKPSGGIPASDLAAGVIPTVPQMATQADTSDWTSGKTVDAAVLKADFTATVLAVDNLEVKKADKTELPDASTSAPVMDGTAAVGTSTDYARADHVHPSDTTRLATTGNAYRTASIPMGHLDSTSTATVMTATVDGITELRDGVCMWLLNGVVTSASGFTLNVNGLGAKPCYSSLAAASRSTTIFNANYTMLLIYNSTRVDGGCWDIVYGVDTNTTYTPPKLGFGYAVCTTAAATAAKTASISSYALTAGGIVSIHFDNDVPANATLNISSKGAKAIYHRGAAITADVIKAGDTATFVYSTYYHLISIDRDETADLTNYQTKAITDTGGYYTTDTVDGALQEIGAELAGINTLIGSGVIT